MNSILVGFSKEGSPVISGETVFYWMDTKGMPLEIINESLRVNSAGFDVVGFIEAALSSKNFTYQKIREKLKQNIDEGVREGFLSDLDIVAKSKGWIK